MASSKQYRRLSVTCLSDHIFTSEKTNEHEFPPVFVTLTGAAAPPALLEDVTELHHCFRPFWVFMRVLGSFPITFTDKGIAVFKVRSRAFAYTSFVVLIASTLCLVSVIQRAEVMKTADFNTMIFSYKCTLYYISYWFFPVGHLLGPGRIARYINELSQFLTRVHQMTGTPLPLKFYKIILFWTIMIPIFVSLMDIYEYYMLDNFSTIESVVIGFTANLICNHMVLWCSMCAILIKASKHIGDMLIEELCADAWGPQVVPKYRALWEELSYMTRASGDVMCYSYGWLIINMFALLTCTTYGFLADSNFSKFGVKEIGLAFNALVVYVTLFIITNSSHFTNNSVNDNFLRKLKQLRSPSKDVQLQLDYFQIAIRLDAPCISLGGYVDVNRGLLVTVLAAIVTYLIVLLQFKVAGSETVKVIPQSSNTSFT